MGEMYGVWILSQQNIFFFLIVWLHHMACGLSVSRPGMEPTPPALEAESPNHWTAREVTKNFFKVTVAANT